MDKDITVAICTYNEQDNIVNCIEHVLKNNIKEIIIIDGGSNDQTLQLLDKYKKYIKLIKFNSVGLASQRAKAVEITRTRYIAFVDAHDFIDKDCIDILISEMVLNNYMAIQAITYTNELETYWQKAANVNTTKSLSKVGETNMIGRPCIYDMRVFKEFNVKFDLDFKKGYGCEDVDISIKMENNKFKMGQGSGRSNHRHPKTFLEHYSKWRKYGRGDYLIIKKYPYKKRAIIKHQLINYCVIRSIEAIKTGNIIYMPYYILQGLTRFIYAFKAKYEKRN